MLAYFKRSALLKRSSNRIITKAKRRSETAQKQVNPEHRANEMSMAKSTRTIARLTVVLALVGVLSAVISYFQWREMNSGGTDTHNLALAAKDQADAAKKQAESAATSAETARKAMLYAQRAWVGPVSASIDGTIEPGKDVFVVVSLRNTGREPALNVAIDPDPFVITKEEDRSGVAAERMNRDINWCFSNKSKGISHVIYPSSGFGSGHDVRMKFSGEDIDAAVMRDERYLVAIGCVSYDTFGRDKAQCLLFHLQVRRDKT